MNKDISNQSHIGSLKNYHRVRQRKTPGLGISALLVVGVLILFSVPIQANDFAFSQETYYAFEDSRSATITIDRVVCEGSSLINDEATIVIREDVSLTWAPRDCSSKSFEEPILNDTIVENDESVELQFTDPSTEEMVSTTLIIEDNDAQSLQDYSVEQIRELTPNDLDSRKDEFKQLSSKDFSRISTNLDKNKVTPADVQEILPNGWTVDLNTGEMTALEGDKLTLNILKKAPTDLSNKITVPADAANLNAGFGVGGMGKPVIEKLEESLGFNITQDTYGSVVTAEVGGTEYIVIPNQDNITQVAAGTPALSIAEGGFYFLTTADGLQIQVSPAPEPLALSEALDDGAVTLGKHGDTLMEIPQDEFNNAVQTRQRKRRKGRTVAISKSSREPARSGLRPGFYKRRTRKGALETGEVVYTDKTAQTVYPTLFQPNTFIKEAKKFDPVNVKEVVFNANGTFYVQYGNAHYLIKPNFEVEIDMVEREAGEPKIVCCDNGLTYTIATDYREDSSERKQADTSSGSTTKQAEKNREIIIAKPDIVPIEADVCEKKNGKIVCDFAKLK